MVTAVPTIPTQEAHPVVDSVVSNEQVTPTKADDSKKVEELNKKVADLEGKLDESQKKQSFLEARINDLVNFIRSIFPTFK